MPCDDAWQAHLALPNVVLIDCRNLDELESHGRIEDALHVPCRLADDATAAVAAAKSRLPADPSTPLLCFCAVGGRSRRVAAALRAAGYARVANGGGHADVAAAAAAAARGNNAGVFPTDDGAPILDVLAGFHDLGDCEWLLVGTVEALDAMAMTVRYHDSLYVATLCVAPRLRRRGLGSLVMKAASAFAAELGFRKVTGAVDADERHLLTMYAALGATEEDAAFASPNATTQPKKRLAAPSGVVGGVPAPARVAEPRSLDDMLADVEHVDRHHKGFEWLLEWDALRLLAPMTGLLGDYDRLAVVDLGCGSSDLAGRFADAFGGAAAGSSFDATLAENDQCGLLLCAFRSLRPGGRYVVVSLYPRDLLAPLFAPLFALDNFASVPRPALATAPAAEAVSVAAFRRRDLAEPPSLGALRDAADATMDDYFKRAETMLTPARVAEIRRNFAAPLPLDAAFAALFTADERVDYARDDAATSPPSAATAAARPRRGRGPPSSSTRCEFLQGRAAQNGGATS
ncbi:hypothetical protein JL722_977 [Aureococcus anophagefferens]|nr:hypothetical protein JL722_977 [Aureococcus anophagefferens]